VVAVDSSSLIGLIQGDSRPDVALLVAALQARAIEIPPAALTEVLSEPTLPSHYRDVVLALPQLAITPDYWVRAAATRSILLARKLRAPLPNTLIAQSCIDHDVPLITGDPDFRHFAKHCGLKLA
jgi:predicted nucleic acid-binding protein